MRLIVLIISVFFIGFIGKSQLTDEQLADFVKDASTKKLVQKNSQLLMNRYYHQSLIVVDKLLEEQSDNSNFNYRKGFAILKVNNDYEKALPHFLLAEKNVSSSYDIFSAKDKSAHIDTYFYLGHCYHLKKDISKAREFYKKYLSTADKSSELYDQTELALLQCDVAEEFLELDKKYEIVNLGSAINTANPEYSPVVSLDGQALYFTTRRLRKDRANEDIKDPTTDKYLEDVYVSRKQDDGSWSEASLLDFSLPERNDATVAVSSDERRIYVYRDDKGNGDLFYSDFEDGRFSDLHAIDVDGVNTDSWEPHISVTSDGDTKYFVSDREGGYGGRDIYKVKKLPNGEWGKPQNLGPNVNTPYDEDAPFIAIDNKTLYFASNGPNSMGGFDIFVSVLTDNEWSAPINLGYPLNSMGDDIYYTTTADGYTGYLSSLRSGGKGEKDIYQIKNDYLGIDNLALLKGHINVKEGQKLPEDVAFMLTCTNCGDDDQCKIRPSLPDGSFVANLKPCRTYEMSFFHGDDETVFYKETFSTDCDRGYDEIVKEITLDVPTMTVIDGDKDDKDDFVFNPVTLTHYFGYNKNKLSTSEGEMNAFIAAVEDQLSNGRESITINIQSSASKVPTRTFKNNMTLAETRGENIRKALYDYFSKESDFEGRVKINVQKAGVNGPRYTSGSGSNIDRYVAYQFVKLSISGEGKLDDLKTKELKSTDSEVKGKVQE